MDAAIIAVFFVVYLGMILGGLPFLQLDRTGVALLGAIALVSIGALTLEEAWGAIHAPTLILLFAFMVMSAQLRLGGFYTWVTWRLGTLPLSPAWLLAARTVPSFDLVSVYRVMWLGFGVNALSGLVLLAAYPAKALTNWVFFLKLVGMLAS